MKNTKRSILDTSRKLFNELGYSQVTIRMIANELKMSSGHLNYHFRKRDDILEALYFEMVEVFDARVQELKDKAISLEYVYITVKSSMERMIDYRFVWTDLYYLLKSNEKIRAHFEQAKADRKAGYQFLFNFLIQAKIMHPPTFAEEHPMLIERMISFGNTWLYASLLYTISKKDEETIEEASFNLLSMLYPYLTEAGQQDFRQIYPSFFTNKTGEKPKQ